MAPSSPVIACFTASPSKPSSAIPTPPGRRVASKMPSVVCAASSRARPTSQPSRIAASTPSCAPTTTPLENALTSKHPQRCSANCCTSNVNPPPRLRGDDAAAGKPGLIRRPRDRDVSEDLVLLHARLLLVLGVDVLDRALAQERARQDHHADE